MSTKRARRRLPDRRPRCMWSDDGHRECRRLALVRACWMDYRTGRMLPRFLIDLCPEHAQESVLAALEAGGLRRLRTWARAWEPAA